MKDSPLITDRFRAMGITFQEEHDGINPVAYVTVGNGLEIGAMDSPDVDGDLILALNDRDAHGYRQWVEPYHLSVSDIDTAVSAIRAVRDATSRDTAIAVFARLMDAHST